MTEYPLEILIMIKWLTHLYEYGLPHAGIGSLPFMSLFEVEHFDTTRRRSTRRRSMRIDARAYANFFDDIRSGFKDIWERGRTTVDFLGAKEEETADRNPAHPPISAYYLI